VRPPEAKERFGGLAHAAALLKDEREDLGSGDVADAGVGVVVKRRSVFPSSFCSMRRFRGRHTPAISVDKQKNQA